MPKGKNTTHDLFGCIVLLPSSCFGLPWARKKFGSNHDEYLLEGLVRQKKRVKNKELIEVYFSFDGSTYDWSEEYILKYTISDASLLGEAAFIKGVLAKGLRYRSGTQQASRGE
jgi:hypothetical protein